MVMCHTHRFISRITEALDMGNPPPELIFVVFFLFYEIMAVSHCFYRDTFSGIPPCL